MPNATNTPEHILDATRYRLRNEAEAEEITIVAVAVPDVAG
jgi:hypothetical protein